MTERTCTGCEKTKPLTLEHFSPNRRDGAGEIVQWMSMCKPCKAAYCRERTRRMTPEQRAERNAYFRAQYRLNQRTPGWTERERVANRERAKRSWAKMKTDPDRYADMLAAQRMNYRLRKWARGEAVRTGHSDAVGGYTDRRRRTLLDVEPFLDALERWYRAQTASHGRYAPPRGLEGREPDPYAGYEQLAELIGVSPRALYRYRTGESPRIALHVADAMAIELGYSLAELEDRR